MSDFSCQPQNLKLFPQTPQNTKRTEFKDSFNKDQSRKQEHWLVQEDGMHNETGGDMKGFYLSKLIAIYVRIHRFCAIVIWHASNRPIVTDMLVVVGDG